MKILWAPIVDSVYIKSFGRRKTWLIPTQFAMGIFMLFAAQNVNEWMGGGAGKSPQMLMLTAVFFVMWFLAATQDVAVDGWALTMLKREHVGFAATCNSGSFLYILYDFSRNLNSHTIKRPHVSRLRSAIRGFPPVRMIPLPPITSGGRTKNLIIFKRCKGAPYKNCRFAFSG